MNSEFTVVPNLSFQDIFPDEAKLTFSTNNEVCRVQVKAGNLLFVIKPDGQQLAFSIENVQQKSHFSELRFTMRKESEYIEWPETTTMTLTKSEETFYEGVITGEGVEEKVRLDIRS